MPDYRHDLMFGVLLERPHDRPQEVVGLAEVAEQESLDVVSLSDHPYWPDGLDTMALLATVVARTTRIAVVPNLANLPLRPPVTLARMAATLDILSGGRFELGIGTGAQQMWGLIVGEGGPRRDAGESVAALSEAVHIVRAVWTSDSPVSFEGEHYRLAGALPGPRPVHDMAIWLGAYQRRMLALTGRAADAWVPSSPFLGPERLAAGNRIIDDAASEAGRSPNDVRRVYNIGGRFAASGSGFLNGPPAVWAEQLADITLLHGVSVYLLYRVDSANVIQRFAREVVPAIRERVFKERWSRVS